jgi:hypothetical protein
VLPRITSSQEAYGNDREAPMLGFGVRWKLLDIMSLDASAARGADRSHETLYSLGLKFSW